MNVFVRCEICRRVCRHRGEINRVTGDRVDGCIVREEEEEVNNYTKGVGDGK